VPGALLHSDGPFDAAHAGNSYDLRSVSSTMDYQHVFDASGAGRQRSAFCTAVRQAQRPLRHFAGRDWTRVRAAQAMGGSRAASAVGGEPVVRSAFLHYSTRRMRIMLSAIQLSILAWLGFRRISFLFPALISKERNE